MKDNLAKLWNKVAEAWRRSIGMPFYGSYFHWYTYWNYISI